MTARYGWPIDEGARFGAVLDATPRADILVLGGDPSLQLFGLGWTPAGSSPIVDRPGRHRAPDPAG